VPARRKSMRKTKEVLRLPFKLGLGQRQIARRNSRQKSTRRSARWTGLGSKKRNSRLLQIHATGIAGADDCSISRLRGERVDHAGLDFSNRSYKPVPLVLEEGGPGVECFAGHAPRGMGTKTGGWHFRGRPLFEGRRFLAYRQMFSNCCIIVPSSVCICV
jgi:hypothetical protein